MRIHAYTCTVKPHIGYLLLYVLSNRGVLYAMYLFFLSDKALAQLDQHFARAGRAWRRVMPSISPRIPSRPPWVGRDAGCRATRRPGR